MKVLFLTDSLSDLDGVGRYAMRLVQELEALDPELEPRFLLARKHRPTSEQVPRHWRIEVGLPPDYFFYMSPLRFFVWKLIGTFNTWRAARGVDVIHAIKDYPHNRVALRAARLAGVPCVATAHGTYTVQPLLDARHARAARRVYSGLARVICVSGYTRRRLLEILGRDAPDASSHLGVDPGKIETIPNAVNAEHYVEARDIGPRPWHDSPFTLSIGEIKERKGHHLALEAWTRVARDNPDLRHYVVGKRPHDEYEERLLAIARDAGLEERLVFLGNVSEDEKVDLLQRALVFTHTPVTAQDGGFEGFGIVYLEASAAGTASLGTLDSGAEDAVVDGKSGLLVAQDVSSVEAALRRLVEDDQLRASLGAGAREHARASSWEANARRVRAIYSEVLEERA